MTKLIRLLLLLVGLLLLLTTGVLHFTRAEMADSEAYQLIFAADFLSQGPQLYTVHLDGSNLQQITFNPDYNQGWQDCPRPSPDGFWVMSTSYYLEVETVFALRTRWGDGEREFGNANDPVSCSLSPWANGWFYYTVPYDYSVYRVRPQNPDQPEIVLESNNYVLNSAAPSPNGRWLFYPANEYISIFFDMTGQRFVHIENFGGCYNPVWSPDSRYVVCVTDADDLRLLDVQTAQNQMLVSGTYPAWSPDTQWIAYWDARELYRIRRDGSEKQLLYTLPDEFAVTGWGERTLLWVPGEETLLLTNVCIPREYTSDCNTYRLRLDDGEAVPIQAVLQIPFGEGEIEERVVSIRDPRLLPPLKLDFNGLPLLLLGGVLIAAGAYGGKTA